MSATIEKCPLCDDTGFAFNRATHARTGPYFALTGKKRCGCPLGEAAKAATANKPAPPTHQPTAG